MRLAAFTVLAVLVLAVPAHGRTLVRYDRSGGFIGVQELLVVTTAGEVQTDGGRHQLSERRLRSLRRVLRRARFETLRRRYEPAGIVNDGFIETVRHRAWTVTVEEGFDPLRRLVRVLERLRGLRDG